MHHYARKVLVRSALPWAVYFFACFSLVYIELAKDRASTPEDSQDAEYLKTLSPDFWYEKLMAKPEPPAKYIAVIVVGNDVPTIVDTAEKEPAFACRRRLFLAELLMALSQLSPRVVVLDMWFNPQACSDIESRPLWNALNCLSERVPVVRGLGSYSLDDVVSLLPTYASTLDRSGRFLRPTELVLMPTQSPPFDSNSKISEGVVQLDANPRCIPLSWPVYDELEIAGEPGKLHRLDSLSVAAVRAVDPVAAVLARFGALNPDSSAKASAELPPHARLLPEEDIPIAQAIDIVCLKPRNKLWETTCHSLGAGSRNRQIEIAGRVVLIGAAGSRDDVHKSQIGNVPGVVLQAEFVESLLQNRVYKSIPFAYQVALGLAWVIALGGSRNAFIPSPAGGRLLASPP